MALVHGKKTVLIVNGANISQYVKTSKYSRKRDIEKVTTYGKESVVKAPSLKDSSLDVDGNYDSTATTGPRALLQTLFDSGDLVPVIRRTEGTGSGKPQDSFMAIVASYEESNPADGYIMWSTTLEISDDVNTTPQS